MSADEKSSAEELLEAGAAIDRAMVDTVHAMFGIDAIAEPGKSFIRRIIMAAAFIPPVEEIERWISEANRDAAVGPLFYPDAWARGRRRLETITALASAMRRIPALADAVKRAAAEEGGDPETDRATQRIITSFHQRYAEQTGRGG